MYSSAVQDMYLDGCILYPVFMRPTLFTIGPTQLLEPVMVLLYPIVCS